jgi:hypothetical protein
MGSLRDFQWALFQKLQEIEAKNAEICQLRRALVAKDHQLDAMKKELLLLQEDVSRPSILPSMTVVANVVLPARKTQKRLAISAEPIGPDFASAATIHLILIPKKPTYVSLSVVKLGIASSLTSDHRVPVILWRKTAKFWLDENILTFHEEPSTSDSLENLI